MGSRKHKKTNQRLLTLFLIISIAIVSAIYFALNRPKEKGDTLQGPYPPTPMEEKNQKITLFFADSNGRLLVGEEREIEGHPSIADQVKECLHQLIQGTQDQDLSPVISPRTQLQGVFLDLDNGIAYVDFSAEISTDHPAGPEAELLTTYAIINTLCHNFPAIKRVQILIAGREEESLAGHIFIQLPLMPAWDLRSGGR
ncbi:MAG: hypothetical protein A3G93_01975 [Nitrospinae bacterium RIFCSPLOWO2_12_FULL_45_22]|nr:MAG: hypothetical protein A3G93_01975 [Nitrospinae bacterium RIFCSPLOWO2_12_FULL_45_22]